MNNNQIAVVKFKGGKRLYGVWATWHRSLSAPLFVNQADAEAHLDCGISRLVDMDAAGKSAEEVEVCLLADIETLLFKTTASFDHGYVTGSCDLVEA